MTVRHGPNLTPRRAPEGLESVIVTRQGPTEPLIQCCEPEMDRGASVDQGGRATDRGSHEESRRAKPGRPSVSEQEREDQDMEEDEKEKRKRVKTKNKAKSGEVIKSTKPSNVKLMLSLIHI